MRNSQTTFFRYYDVKAEITFHGRVDAPTLPAGAEHFKAVIVRRLKSASIKGDKHATITGFTKTGVVVTSHSNESRKAEVAQLKALVLKYPQEAHSALGTVIDQRIRLRKKE